MVEVKRFILFTGDSFYPNGGWSDFRDGFLTEDEAVEAANTFVARAHSEGTHSSVWWQIADITTGKIVKEGVSDDPVSDAEPNPDALVGNEESLTIVAGQRSRLTTRRAP